MMILLLKSVRNKLRKLFRTSKSSFALPPCTKPSDISNAVSSAKVNIEHEMSSAELNSQDQRNSCKNVPTKSRRRRIHSQTNRRKRPQLKEGAHQICKDRGDLKAMNYDDKRLIKAILQDWSWCGATTCLENHAVMKNEIRPTPAHSVSASRTSSNRKGILRPKKPTRPPFRSTAKFKYTPELTLL